MQSSVIVQACVYICGLVPTGSVVSHNQQWLISRVVEYTWKSVFTWGCDELCWNFWVKWAIDLKGISQYNERWRPVDSYELSFVLAWLRQWVNKAPVLNSDWVQLWAKTHFCVTVCVKALVCCFLLSVSSSVLMQHFDILLKSFHNRTFCYILSILWLH